MGIATPLLSGKFAMQYILLQCVCNDEILMFRDCVYMIMNDYNEDSVIYCVYVDLLKLSLRWCTCCLGTVYDYDEDGVHVGLLGWEQCLVISLSNRGLSRQIYQVWDSTLQHMANSKMWTKYKQVFTDQFSCFLQNTRSPQYCYFAYTMVFIFTVILKTATTALILLLPF
jgi:hypothetical protein